MQLIADNIHGLNPLVADALRALDPKPIEERVKRCEQAGATFIDLNPGHLSRSKEDRMTFLVETVQALTSMVLVLDSPNPRVLEKGLLACREKPILNALSLEEQKVNEILPLAVEHETDLVVLLMDERSFTPPSMEEKLALAIELRDRALAAGLPGERLIFDPVLPNLSWDDAHQRVGEAVKTVRYLAGGAVFQESTRTMVGLSNLRSGLRSRYGWEIEKAALTMCAGAGLSYVLADVLRPEFQETFQVIKSIH